MLKFLRGLVIALGIVLVGAAIALMVVSYIQINYLVTSTSAPNMESNWKPLYWWYLIGAAVGSLVGAFCLGLGVGMPKRSFKKRLKDIETQSAPASTPGSLSSVPVSAPVEATPVKDQSLESAE